MSIITLSSVVVDASTCITYACACNKVHAVPVCPGVITLIYIIYIMTHIHGTVSNQNK